jgi:hypothetical protein
MTKDEKRGRPIECRYCGHKFKITNKEKRRQWIDDQFPCPFCNELYCYMIKIEKDLQIIQRKFKQSGRDEKYLKEIYDLLVIYAEGMIKGRYINEIQDKSLLPIYARSAASLLVESDFYKKKDFYIDSSFGSRLQKKCMQALRSKKESYERTTIDDSLDYVLQDGHTVEYEDETENEISKVEQKEEKILLLQRICQILFGIEEKCESSFENYIRLLNVYNYLEGGEQAIDKFFEIYGRYGKYKTMESLTIIRKEISNSRPAQKNHSKRIIKENLSHEEIMSNKFKVNNTWQKVSLASKEKDNTFYFFNGQWRDLHYFNNLIIKN